MLRRSFLKACAVAAVCLSSLLPDLMPGPEKKRASEWQIRISDPLTGRENIINLPLGSVPLHPNALAMFGPRNTILRTEPAGAR